VIPLRAPALRDRPDDIPVLVSYFLDHYSRLAKKRVTDIPAETMKVFTRYRWPGNVRELQNVVERAVVLSQDRVLRPALEDFQDAPETSEIAPTNRHESPTTLKDVEREHILQALAATNWVLGGPKGAGARLGLARTTLIAKMQKLGITRALA